MGPGYTYSNERDLFGTIRGEFDITDKVMAWAALGGRSSDESSFTTTPEVINQAGDMTMTGMTVARKDSIKTGEIGLRAKFNTGSRSEERRVGKAGVSTGSSRRSPYY